MASTRRRRSRQVAAAIVLVLALPAIWITWNQAHANFGVVQPGRVYRSAQMSASRLAQTLREHQIRTVLNLRGPNPEHDWYRAERGATLAAGATQIDVALSSCVWMSRAQLHALIRILDSSEYPILIHCAWGSERTGLVSAFSRLLQEGSTLDDARAELALQYLYVPFGDGRIMSEALDQYQGWLGGQGLAHRPEIFRRWAAEGYKPGVPDRERWAWDPYPLTVVTRPELKPAPSTALRDGSGERR